MDTTPTTKSIDCSTTHNKKPRPPSAYNIFMTTEIPLVRAENPSLDHREAFKIAQLKYGLLRSLPDIGLNIKIPPSWATSFAKWIEIINNSQQKLFLLKRPQHIHSRDINPIFFVQISKTETQ
jgi:hypothetical protein